MLSRTNGVIGPAPAAPTAAGAAPEASGTGSPGQDGEPQLALSPCAIILLLLQDAARLAPPPSTNPLLGTHLDTYA